MNDDEQVLPCGFEAQRSGAADPPATDARLIGEIGLHVSVVLYVLDKIEAIVDRSAGDAAAREVLCGVSALNERLQALADQTRRRHPSP